VLQIERRGRKGVEVASMIASRKEARKYEKDNVWTEDECMM
jgi:hypothetical protein